MKATVFCSGLLMLAACAPTVPDSNPRGVGFGDYGTYIKGQQAANQPQTIAPPPVVSQPLGQAAVIGQTPPGGRAVSVPQTGDLSADVQAVLNATSPGGAAPMPSVAPQPATAAPAVAEPATAAPVQETASPVVPLPERADDGRPNIVAYAIKSKNAVGQQAYARTNANESASVRACAKFASPDRAQEAFLSAGGPDRDGKSLDPDGDGFACDWDPTPFRQTGQ